MTWAFSLQPQDNELLSSFLARASFAHGSTPHSFFRLHLGDGWYWTRDIDRGVARQHHQVLSNIAGLNKEDLQRHTLRRWIQMLTPEHYSKATVSAIVPWINVVGIQQEGRRFHGLQFCPECLATEGMVDRRWRLSFHVYCTNHKRRMLDACPNCGAAFVPHRSLGSVLRCHACQQNLASTRTPEASKCWDAPTATFQEAMVNSLALSSATTSISSSDMLAIRCLVTALFNGKRAPITADELAGHIPEKISSWRRLEFGRIEQRLEVMRCLNILLDQWPEKFRILAVKTKLNQLAFRNSDSFPVWLRTEVHRLPAGRRKPRKKSGGSLETKLVALEKAKPKNWRAMRAELLLRAASRA